MTKYARKNQLKQAEMQGNKAKIVQEEMGSRKMITQLNKKQLKQFKNHSQSGRSMVEMLGVLAIIAILSIGGIIGFRLAMNYYQANQIAHEMNMMRTDAQIKIAQGAEKLTLGSPYDELKINFNNYDTAFGCKYVDENDIISEETVSCQIANAYYIELPKIPNGVCQPLIRLINGMDNLIAFSVNDSEYEEGGTCQEGENDLYAVFSGETVSDLTHCEGDDDCKELESTPVCDPSRHVCVRCYEDNQCAHNQYCENNTCVTCESGVWNGTSCVECTEDNDCLKKGTEKPVCNENKCEPCPEGESWKESAQGCAAYECRTNEDCNPDDGFENYCYYKNLAPANRRYEWSDGESAGGICKEVSNAFQKTTIQLNGNTYYGSRENMTWWSACRLCAAWKHKEDSICESSPSGTTAEPDFMLDVSGLNCNPSYNSQNQELGICYKNQSTNTLADSIIELRKIWGCTTTQCNYFPWLSNSYDLDYVYNLGLVDGKVHKDHRFGVQGANGSVFGDYAVCR